MLWVGLISIVFLEAMAAPIVLLRRAWAFMIRSMLADQEYSPVTKQQGEEARREETTTFSTLSSRISLISLQRPSEAALASSKVFFSSSLSASLRPSLVAHTNFL